MALHESVLEEFGLSPLWVRRGIAAREVAGDAQTADHAEAAPASDIAHGAHDAPAEAAEAVAHIQRAETATPPVRESMRESMRSPADTREPPTQREPAPSHSRYEDDAPRQPSSQQPQPSPEPSNLDIPPDDDFAWFDDPSASAPASAFTSAEARHDAPMLPAIHTLDWDALGERVAACQACRLCEKRTNTVFGVGDRDADWMLIGEAPGENEDRQGEPFVGQAGKLLDNMLHSLALARGTNVYIANVIKCRPPGNRNPQPDEVARCEPYLQRQVSLVKPKLIVALGRFAAQSLLKTEASISSLRGRVHTYEGVPVIVTYHPAYLLRSLPDKAKAWADLCLARDTWLKGGGAPSSEAE
ncbi:uracil-DNA glycosylase [Paraburkholderia sp. ZP32-5]|uniref:uracil-DNA glycosylase n=1 Tax=Paraburkholderia sp. ZP32-5 TaxID=2883245 RepID=UPI001F3EB7A5|nr:uracil-DNA glycosylase [Paraburkholderia sp. ZP32-5]